MNEGVEQVIKEWIQRAMDDLESAELVLNESDNYEISAYHSHQAIEKMIKAELIRQGETFRFIHDINALFTQLFKGTMDQELFDEISFVNSLYPRLRYPTGEYVQKDQADKCLKIAKKVKDKLKISL
ncbi:MAG: HEPN domain-containing protein [Candidatus Margulisiibacteriota bacterium]